MGPVFPIVRISAQSVSVFRTEESLRRRLSFATDKAINDGVFERAAVIDSCLSEYRFKAFQLAGSTGIFGWLKRARKIERLALEHTTDTTLSGLKARVRAAISSDEEFWSENFELDDLYRQIDAANSVDSVMSLFG